MTDPSKTKKELLKENAFLKQRIQELKQSESERKQAEEALRESENKFKCFAEQSFVGIYLIQDGVFQYVNPRLAEIFGYSVEECDKLDFRKLVFPDDLEKAVEQVRKRILGKVDSVQREFRGIKKNREVVDLEIYGSLISFHGKPAAIGTILDITDRKRAEEALRESQQRLIAAQHISRIGDVTWDVETGEITWSDALYDLMGYDKSENLDFAKVNAEINHPDDLARVTQWLNDSIASGSDELAPNEYRVIRKDGQILYVRTTGVIRREEGKQVKLFVTLQDITERKQAEEALREREHRMRLAGRIEQVREEEKVMISREIHDVMGGGLTGLKMDLSWLMNKMKKAESDKERTAMVNRILSSSETVDKMIKVTRRISTELRPPVLDDLGLIAALEWQLSEFTSRTGILHKFTTAIEYVNIERDQSISVFRIFQEALTNIARHSGATKAIIILREDGRNLSGDENLVLEIRDNGRGFMDEEILNKKTLGLLGMKERAMVFGGEFSIRGEPGVGTTVVLKIPRKRGEPS